MLVVKTKALKQCKESYVSIILNEESTRSDVEVRDKLGMPVSISHVGESIK